MPQTSQASKSNRRQFLQQGGAIAAGAAVLAGRVPAVHAAEDNTIRLALIGCGGRGTGAVANALNTADQGPIKLYATADLDKDNVDRRLKSLKGKYPDQLDVTEDRKFIGFASHKQAIDIVRPGDIAHCTTRAYIRPVHVEYRRSHPCPQL